MLEREEAWHFERIDCDPKGPIFRHIAKMKLKVRE